MITYFSLFIYICIISLVNEITNKLYQKLLFIFVLLILFLFVGLRYHVGGDFNTYSKIFDSILDRELLIILYSKEPSYYLLSYFIKYLQISNGLILVNLICSFLLFFGFYFFCKKINFPFLAILIFYHPMIYLCMGSTRQSVTLGILFYILSLNVTKHFIKIFFLSCFAFTFHVSSVLFFLLNFLHLRIIFLFIKNNLIISSIIFLSIIISIFLIYVNNYIKLDNFFNIQGLLYINNNMYSKGGFFKHLPNLIAAFIFLVFRKQFKIIFTNYIVYFYISLICIFMYIMLFFASTIVDRLMIFSLPLQIMVLSNLINIIKYENLKIFYYFFIQFVLFLTIYVWFNVGHSSVAWIPYNLTLPFIK